MAAPAPYLQFAGDAAQALRLYREVFGGELTLHTFAEFGREDGPPDSVAHGILSGPVDLFGADGADGDPSRRDGVMLSLLGFAPPATLHRWFEALSVGGEVVEPLKRRPWGAADGTVRDRFGVTWLIGYEGDAENE